MNEKTRVLQAMPDRRRAGKGRIKMAIVAAVLAGLGFWLLHPPVLSWMAREYIGWKFRQMGLTASAERIRIRIGQPIQIENFRAGEKGSPSAGTRIAARHISISFASLWEIFFGDGRIVDHLTIENAEGKFDWRTRAESSAVQTPDGKSQSPRLRMSLRLLPKNINARAINLQFLTASETYEILDASIGLSESELGTLQVGKISMQGNGMRRTFTPDKGVTAWKNGSLYLSNFSIAETFQIENFTTDFLRDEGIALGFDIRAFGGYVRGDLSFGANNGPPDPYIDGALIITQLNLEGVPKFLGANATLSGLIRAGRITFHGNPRNILKTQVSLRIAADKVRWNRRGWDTLTLSANLVDAKIVVPEFTLRQAENHVDLSGEMTFPARFTREEIRKADYVVSGTADIKDLSSLDVLLGKSFKNMKGRLSLKMAVKGRASDVTGNLSLKANHLLYRGAPAEQAEVKIEFVQHEARITHFKLLNGNDSVTAHAGINLRRPHNYWGDILLKVNDLAPYLRLLSPKDDSSGYRGKMDAFWQGDGTLGSHSGVFDIKTAGLLTKWTPAGISGEFKGSYSPDNLHFNKFLFVRNAFMLSLQATLARSGMHFQNILFSREKEKFLEGGFFVPVDVLKILQGAGWRKAILPDAQMDSKVSSRKLPLKDFAEILGRNEKFTGTLTSDINISGPMDSPKIAVVLDAYQYSLSTPAHTFPSSQVSVLLLAADGKASLQKTITVDGFQPARMSLAVPFHPKADAQGRWQFLDPNAAVMMTLDFPRTTAAVLGSLFPSLQETVGILSGHIDIRNTLSAPQIAGHVELSNATVEVSPDLPRMEKLNALLVFEKNRAALRRLSGMISEGPFEAKGEADLKNPANVAYRMQLHGKKILLPTDSSFRLLADIDLTAEGDSKDGMIRGNIHLVESQTSQKLQVTPLLAPSTIRQETGRFPVIFDKNPFSRWTLDIAIQNDSSLQLDNGAGKILSKLHLTGTLGDPLPEGEILLKDFKAYFPAGVFHIPEGRLFFNLSSPRIAMLDLRGETQVAGYKIYAQARGPMKEQRLSVRSEPALNPQAMLLLLTKGVTAEVSSSPSLAGSSQNARPALTAPSLSLPQKGATPSETEMIYNFRFVEEPASR